MITLLTALAPLAIQLLGVILNKMNADAETQANFLAVVKWAQGQNLVSKTLHDSFEAQGDRNAAEILKLREAAKAASAPKGPLV